MREGEKHQCVIASHAPPTGDLASNPGMCPDWEVNQCCFVLHTGAQSPEPHQPGLNPYFLITYNHFCTCKHTKHLMKVLCKDSKNFICNGCNNILQYKGYIYVCMYVCVCVCVYKKFGWC